MTKTNRIHTNKINVWPVGTALQVNDAKKIPTPNKVIGAYSGYLFYKTRHGVYALWKGQWAASLIH